MKFKPLGDRVLVKRTDEEQTTEGWLDVHCIESHLDK